MSDQNVDYLDEDPPIRGQKFVCISFLVPTRIGENGIENIPDNKKIKGGIKIRGSYDTHDEAAKRAKFLQKKDRNFNVFVGEVGKWLPWNPTHEHVENEVFAEKELNELMKNYKENIASAQDLQEERIAAEIEQSARSSGAPLPRNRPMNRKEQMKEKLAKKLEKRQRDMKKTKKDNTEKGDNSGDVVINEGNKNLVADDTNHDITAENMNDNSDDNNEKQEVKQHIKEVHGDESLDDKLKQLQQLHDEYKKN